MASSSRWGVSLAFLALFLGFSPETRADRLEKLENEVESTNLDKAIAAAKSLGRMRPNEEALIVLMETLLLGAPPKLSIALINAIAGYQSPKTFYLLAHYTENRNEEVRATAYRALGRVQPVKYKDKVFQVAMKALRDGASSVRAAGASLIADLKKGGLLSDKQVAVAEKLLLHILLVRKDQRSAGIALSVIGTAKTARFLAIHLADLPERIVTTLCAAFLKRPGFGPEPVRMWVVMTLGKLTGPEAITALMEYIASSEGKKPLVSVVLARKITEK